MLSFEISLNVSKVYSTRQDKDKKINKNKDSFIFGPPKNRGDSIQDVTHRLKSIIANLINKLILLDNNQSIKESNRSKAIITDVWASEIDFYRF